MSDFDPFGGYRFLYTDHSGQETMIYVSAECDDDAINFAKGKQHGLNLEVWEESRLIGKLLPGRYDVHSDRVGAGPYQPEQMIGSA